MQQNKINLGKQNNYSTLKSFVNKIALNRNKPNKRCSEVSRAGYHNYKNDQIETSA